MKFPVLVCKVLPTGENLLQQLPIQLLNLRHLRMAVGWTKQEFPGIACLLRSCPNMERLTLDMLKPVNVDWWALLNSTVCFTNSLTDSA